MAQPNTSAIIVAAGGAHRMGTDKLLAPLHGEPLLQRTLRAFADCAEIGEILLIAPAERAAQLVLPAHCRVIAGGAERRDSVWAGLQAAVFPYVAVHDGARPLISPEAIQRTIAAAQLHGAAALAKPVTDTLKRATEQLLVTDEQIDRSRLWSMETPQVAERSRLVAAYEIILREQSFVTDEVSALQRAGIVVQLVESLSPNLKITYPHDLRLAELLLPT